MIIFIIYQFFFYFFFLYHEPRVQNLTFCVGNFSQSSKCGRGSTPQRDFTDRSHRWWCDERKTTELLIVTKYRKAVYFDLIIRNKGKSIAYRILLSRDKIDDRIWKNKNISESIKIKIIPTYSERWLPTPPMGRR